MAAHNQIYTNIPVMKLLLAECKHIQGFYCICVMKQSLCLLFYLLCLPPPFPPSSGGLLFSPTFHPFSSKAKHVHYSLSLHHHLCCAVSNAIMLTPAVSVSAGESCWVHVIATPPPPFPFSHFHLSACRPAVAFAPQVSCHCLSGLPDTLPAKNRLHSTTCN